MKCVKENTNYTGCGVMGVIKQLHRQLGWPPLQYRGAGVLCVCVCVCMCVCVFFVSVEMNGNLFRVLCFCCSRREWKLLSKDRGLAPGL